MHGSVFLARKIFIAFFLLDIKYKIKVILNNNFCFTNCMNAPWASTKNYTYQRMFFKKCAFFDFTSLGCLKTIFKTLPRVGTLFCMMLPQKRFPRFYKKAIFLLGDFSKFFLHNFPRALAIMYRTPTIQIKGLINGLFIDLFLKVL